MTGTPCTLCPRACHVLRPGGRCGMPEEILISRAALHRWEEPCISGERGSGTVFFTGCNLGCVFCQNRAISGRSSTNGQRITPARLRQLCLALIREGAHNINFVTPTHYADRLPEIIGEGLGVPVIYNSGGYERVETLKRLDGKIDVYMPDLKYSQPSLAEQYSGAPDYVERACEAILEMYRQTGDYRLDETGMLQRGVLIRHLVLPGAPGNTRGVISWIARHFRPGQVLFSLMGQYTPVDGIGTRFPALGTALSEEEYEAAASYLELAGIEDGYLQPPAAAGEDYIPSFGSDSDFVIPL